MEKGLKGLLKKFLSPKPKIGRGIELIFNFPWKSVDEDVFVQLSILPAMSYMSNLKNA